MNPSAGERAGRILLLTGRPGVGKTTALRRAAERLDDLSIGGFYTEEVRDDGGRRTGFRAASFGGEQGDARLIASTEFHGSPRVSRYGVDVGAVDEVSERHLAAEGADAVFVDEIGKMECCSERFIERIRDLLSGGTALVATVALRGGGLVREVKEVEGAELLEVTPGNRDEMPERIAARMRKAVR